MENYNTCMADMPAIDFLTCTQSVTYKKKNAHKHRKKLQGETTVGRMGRMAYDPGPTFRNQVANADDIGLDKIKNEYELIQQKRSNLSARQRALILYKVQEYNRLGIIK